MFTPKEIDRFIASGETESDPSPVVADAAGPKVGDMFGHRRVVKVERNRSGKILVDLECRCGSVKVTDPRIARNTKQCQSCAVAENASLARAAKAAKAAKVRPAERAPIVDQYTALRSAIEAVIYSRDLIDWAHPRVMERMTEPGQ